MNDQKKRKFKGSVLFTVVFVMSILIVLLFGTLTLAYATNSRAHVNYSSAQTGITSRLITESAIKAINGNTDYASAVGDMGSGGLSVNVSISNDKDNIGSMGHISPVTISKVGEKEYWDFQNKKWQTRDVLKFTSTVNQAGVESTSSAYVIKHYTEDVITQSKGGAGFVTTAGASLECNTSLFGGSYINLPKWDSSLNEIEFYNNLSSYIASPSITNKGETKIFPAYNSSDKGTYLFGRNSGSEMEADIAVYNNVDMNNFTGIIFPDKAKGLTVFGDLIVAANADKFKFAAGDNLKKYYTPDTNGKYASIKFNEIPYVYVNGKMIGNGYNGKLTLGSVDFINNPPFPLNVFVGSADMDNINEFNLNTDLFLMDENATSVFKFINQGKNALLTWVGSVINRTEPNNVKNDTQKGAGLYSNGNVIIKEDSIIYGDVRVKGNCEILGNNTVIHGDLVVGGSLKLADNVKIDGNLYCDKTKLTTNNTTYVGSTATYYAAEVDNLLGYYYRWDLQNEKAIGPDGLYYGPTGELIGDGEKYKDRELSECEALIYTLQYGVKTEDVNPDDKDDLAQKIQADVEPLINDEERHKAEDNDMAFYIETYLADTDADGNDVAVTINVKDGNINVEELLDKRKPAGYSKVYNKSFTVSKTEGGSSAMKPIASVAQYTSSHNGDIYPSFATREVVLGLKAAKAGVPIKDTKIVKTLKEILDSGADPYKYSDPDTIPGNFKAEYEKALNNSYTSFDLMESDMGTYVKGDLDVTHKISSIEKTTNADEKSTETGASATKGAYYINKSCYLNFGGSMSVSKEIEEWNSTWTCTKANVTPCTKTIVIDPGSSEIVVVIDTLDFTQKGYNSIILVDDSNGGTVDLYIKGGIHHNGVNNKIPIFTTLSYFNELVDPSTTSGKINSNSTEANNAKLDMGALDKPKLNIYGGTGSVLWIENFSFMVGNVISPELTVCLNSTDQSPYFTDFYYNNENILKPKVGSANNKWFVFGCLNAQEVYMKNIVNVVYVPDKSGKGGGADAEAKDYKYYVLYYSDN